MPIRWSRSQSSRSTRARSGNLGQERAGISHLSGRRQDPSRSGAGLPRRSRGRLRGDRRPQMGVPVELEVRGGEFSRRHLSQPEPSLGRPDRHRASAASGKKGRRDDELEKAQHVWISFPEGHGVHSAIQPEHNEYIESFLDNPVLEQYFRHCFEERKRRLGEQARLMPFVGTISPTPHTTGGSRAASAPGIRTARPRRKAGDSSSSTPTRRRK